MKNIVFEFIIQLVLDAKNKEEMPILKALLLLFFICGEDETGELFELFDFYAQPYGLIEVNMREKFAMDDLISLRKSESTVIALRNRDPFWIDLLPFNLRLKIDKIITKLAKTELFEKDSFDLVNLHKQHFSHRYYYKRNGDLSVLVPKEVLKQEEKYVK